MSRRLGNHYRLYVGDGGSPEAFTVLAGQKGLTRDESTPLIDQSSKETGQYSLQTPGRKALTLSINGVMELPDASGIEAVHDASVADPQVATNFQIVDIQPSPDKIVFQCSMYVSNWNQGAEDQDNATYSFQLTAAAAPSVDDLTP